MSNTVKIGTIFLACLLNLFQAAALKEIGKNQMG